MSTPYQHHPHQRSSLINTALNAPYSTTCQPIFFNSRQSQRLSSFLKPYSIWRHYSQHYHLSNHFLACRVILRLSDPLVIRWAPRHPALARHNRFHLKAHLRLRTTHQHHNTHQYRSILQHHNIHRHHSTCLHRLSKLLPRQSKRRLVRGSQSLHTDLFLLKDLSLQCPHRGPPPHRNLPPRRELPSQKNLPLQGGPFPHRDLSLHTDLPP